MISRDTSQALDEEVDCHGRRLVTSSSLQQRIRYDPLLAKLQIYGRLNNKEIGDDSLTAAPPAVYVLEPNILTETDRAELLKLSTNQKWIDAINDLAKQIVAMMESPW